MEPNENLLSADLQVDEVAMIHLRETARWAKFLGMVGMILSILIALVGIFAGFLLSSLSNRYGSASATMIGSGFISFFYIIIAAICFFTSLFLYFFGAKMKNALMSVDQLLFNESLLNLKRYYRIVGILTIIYLGFLLLFLLIAIVTASVSSL